MKKRVVIVLALLLVISMVSAAQVKVEELFQVEEKIDETSRELTGTTTYFYAGSKLIASKNSEIKYHYQNRLGSDTNSKQLPFGQEIYSGERFSFTGKELDASDLHYFGARYYDSNLGKFTSVDPIPSEPPYAYVSNNPMNYVDPTGTKLRFITDYDDKVSWERILESNIEFVTPQKEAQKLANGLLGEINNLFGKEILKIDSEGYIVPTNVREFYGNPPIKSSDHWKAYNLITQAINSKKEMGIIFRSDYFNSGMHNKNKQLIILTNLPKGTSFGPQPLGEDGKYIRMDSMLITLFHEIGHSVYGSSEKESIEKAGNPVRRLTDAGERETYRWFSEGGKTYFITPEGYDKGRFNIINVESLNMLGLSEGVDYKVSEGEKEFRRFQHN